MLGGLRAVATITITPVWAAFGPLGPARAGFGLLGLAWAALHHYNSELHCHNAELHYCNSELPSHAEVAITLLMPAYNGLGRLMPCE